MHLLRGSFKLQDLLLFLILNGISSGTHVLDPFEPVIKQRLLELRRSVLGESEDLLTEVTSRVASFYLPVHSTSASCRADSHRVIQGLLDGEMWALRMFDASSKPVSGMLDGHFQDLGNFQECVKVMAPDGQFSGKHCLVETHGLLPWNLERYFNKHHVFPKSCFPVDVVFSLCVPSSCTPEDVSAHMNIMLSRVNATARLYPDSCTTIHSPPLETRGWLAISFFTLIFVLVVLSTWYDKKNREESDILTVFSLKRSYSQLMDVSSSWYELTCLSGLRVLLNALNAIQHRIIYQISLPVTRYVTLIEMADSIWHISHLTMTTDVFFLIGGVLRSYNFFLARKKGRPYSFLREVYQRYFRVTPVLATLVLIYATLSRHICSGPLTPRYMSPKMDNCQSNWWLNLLHISNYIRPKEMCAPTTYYLAMDFQLFVLSPLLLVPLHKSTRVGLTLMVTTFLAMVLMGFVNSYVNEIPATNVLTLADIENDDYLTNFLTTHIRPSAYIIGLLLGWWIYLMKHDLSTVVLVYKFKSPSITAMKRMIVCAWLFNFLLLVCTTYSSKVFPLWGHTFHPWLDPWYNALHRPLFVVPFGWAIYACSTGIAVFLNKVLSLPVFVILSRLTFSHYLLHILVIEGHVMSMDTTWSFQNVFHGFFADMVISYLLAAVVYMTIEVPFYKLAMHFIGGKKTKTPSASMHEKKCAKLE